MTTASIESTSEAIQDTSLVDTQSLHSIHLIVPLATPINNWLAPLHRDTDAVNASTTVPDDVLDSVLAENRQMPIWITPCHRESS